MKLVLAGHPQSHAAFARCFDGMDKRQHDPMLDVYQ